MVTKYTKALKAVGVLIETNAFSAGTHKVTVKVTDIRDGKLSLSMRALEERSERPERADRPERRGGNRKSSYLEETDGFEYVEKTQAVTSLGDLLKGIKL